MFNFIVYFQDDNYLIIGKDYYCHDYRSQTQVLVLVNWCFR